MKTLLLLLIVSAVSAYKIGTRQIAKRSVEMISPLLGTSLRIAGPVIFTGMQISSAKTALKIVQDKDVGSFSPLPFTALLTNCIVWYALLSSNFVMIG